MTTMSDTPTTLNGAPNMTDTPSLHSSLQTLRRQYFALVPPYLLQTPDTALLASEASQEYLLSALVYDTTLPAPEPGYLRGFWKMVLRRVEEGVEVLSRRGEEAAVDERIYETIAEIMAAPGGSTGMTSLAQQSYKTFLYDLPPWATSGDESDKAGKTHEASVTLLEEQVVVQAGTTGLRTWTAALHLAHHIISSPHLIFPSIAPPTSPESPDSVKLPAAIELGSGAGFLSTVLGQLGADVIATDLDDGDDEDDEDQNGDGDRDGERDEEDEMDGTGLDDKGYCSGARRTPFRRLKANLALNKCRRQPRAVPLNWDDATRRSEDRPAVWAEITAQPRTIVATDVIYDPDLVPLLVNTLDALLPSVTGPGQPTAIIGATVRNAETFNLFLSECAQHGLAAEVLDLEPMDITAPTFWDTALDLGTPVKVVRVSRE